MRPVLRLLLVVSAFMLLALPAPLRAQSVESSIAQILNSGQRLPLPIEKVRSALVAYYVKGGGQAYWVGSNRMGLFTQRLKNALYDGLDPSAYPTDSLVQLAQQARSGSAQDAATAELYYSAFYVAYAADLRIGRVTPQKVDPNLFRTRKTLDALRVLNDMGKQQDPGKYLSAYEPRNNHYQVLKRMLRVYTQVIDEGIDWPVVGQGDALKPGGSDGRVPAIRTLLSFTGDYDGPESRSTVYDPALFAAVKTFQARHGLEAKGLLGKQTVTAMNVSPRERQKQIILNMERWRWMPDNLGDEHFLINIAGYELDWVQGKAIKERMGVVVGAVATQTPEFTGEMQYVELNPTWTVPYSIATKEMLPKLRANPYEYAEDFEVFANGKLSDWSSINWSSYGAGKFPFTFRQKPGPRNALGKVKFMLPNSHNIYLHDTPAKDKFANSTRAFSHGCIRLSRPIDLAYELLGEKVGMSKSLVDAIWATGKTKRVDLPKRIPVHMVYATAFATDRGIEFRSDVYGRDRKLYEALFGRPQS
ncbi:MAG: L,D-transpeptidase family protein [Proteobacteria bacterium]|nr:L,D-transpeptidase family protein [Pseudomonadota bacterium]